MSQNTQTPKAQDQTMTVEQLQEKLRKMEAELAQKNAQLQAKINLKVSEKGGVSLIGLQRFPITLYADQWLQVLNHRDHILAFIERNKDSLKAK